MNLKHDLRCVPAIHGEIFLQDDHDEIHRGEIVVEQEHPVERGTAKTRTLSFQYGFALFLDCGHTYYFNPVRLPFGEVEISFLAISRAEYV